MFGLIVESFRINTGFQSNYVQALKDDEWNTSVLTFIHEKIYCWT